MGGHKTILELSSPRSPRISTGEGDLDTARPCIRLCPQAPPGDGASAIRKRAGAPSGPVRFPLSQVVGSPKRASELVSLENQEHRYRWGSAIFEQISASSSRRWVDRLLIRSTEGGGRPPSKHVLAAGDVHGACSFSWFSGSRYLRRCLLAFRTHPAPYFSPIYLLVVAYAPDIRAASSTRGTRPSSFGCSWSRSR